MISIWKNAFFLKNALVIGRSVVSSNDIIVYESFYKKILNSSDTIKYQSTVTEILKPTIIFITLHYVFDICSLLYTFILVSVRAAKVIISRLWELVGRKHGQAVNMASLHRYGRTVYKSKEYHVSYWFHSKYKINMMKLENLKGYSYVMAYFLRTDWKKKEKLVGSKRFKSKINWNLLRGLQF